MKKRNIYNIMDFEYNNLFCKNCFNRDQESFVVDYHHGSMICTKCGAEMISFQLLQLSYCDYSNYSSRTPLSINDSDSSNSNNVSSGAVFRTNNALKKTQTHTNNVALNIVCTDKLITFDNQTSLKEKKTLKLVKVLNVIEYLVKYFNLSQSLIQKGISFYERHQSIYEQKYVAKKKIWASACFYLACQSKRLCISFKEISLSMKHVEPKKISKMVSIIKMHDEAFLRRNNTDVIINDNIKKNRNSIARLTNVLNMDFEQQKLTRVIVNYIDSEELISGLNPLSILSVSFFLSMILTQKNLSDANKEVFLKTTLKKVSSTILIAINTIKKGIRESKETVMNMLLRDSAAKMFVDKTRVLRVKEWQI
jgi:transcription initiation factor TFIIIB Brf1 subunit/transcription initiation factor TFIIB